MKTTVIFSGSFSAKGNLFYHDPTFGDVHVSSKMLASLGVTDAATLSAKAPLYGLLNTRVIQRRDPAFPDATGNDHLLFDADNKPVTTERLEVGSIYPSEAAMIAAMNAGRSINIKALAALNTVVAEAGLTTESLKTLQETSVF